MDTVAASEEEAHEEHHDHGLSDVGYIKIALILGVLTAVEVATYFWDFGILEVPSLLILMVVKFQIVCSYFMHLKFDSKSLATYLSPVSFLLWLFSPLWGPRWCFGRTHQAATSAHFVDQIW